MWRTCLLGLSVLCGAVLFGSGSVHAMQMVESFPAARAVIDGRNAQYVVRFDSLVNHRDSLLTITQNGHTVETLHLILRSDPKALAASAPRLPSGEYELHWSARSVSGEASEGSVPFTVRP
jgi:methionine-rich copper-binding protein CopC